MKFNGGRQFGHRAGHVRLVSENPYHSSVNSLKYGIRGAMPVGSKNSAELEVVLSTAVAAARISIPQPLELTHLALEAGRFSAHDRVSNAIHSPALPHGACRTRWLG